MMNTIQKLEQAERQKLTASKKIPDFKAGDTLRVLVNVVEGDRKRVQAFEGVCIARKNASLNSSFTVRKLSYGEGVERVFPLYSPLINVEVVRQGDVRRAKLYYLRGRTGKSARIREKAFWLSNAGTAAQKEAAAMEVEQEVAAPEVATVEAPTTEVTAAEEAKA